MLAQLLMDWRCRLAAVVGTTVVVACTINPVTGERELALVGQADEIAIGQNQYAPARQMQGGDFTLYPAVNAYVAEVGARVAAVSDRALPYEFVVLNSSVPNAWALPGGKIAVNRGLLTELNSEGELAAVLGHEVVHAAARHGALAMQRGLLLQGVLLATSVAAQRSNYSGLAVGAASVAAQLVNQRYGREAELDSDFYGMQYMSRAGYDPSAAISLQEVFLSLSEGREQSWLDGLFASHPPSAERVERNRATAATLPATGEVGAERYAEVMAPLRAAQPAYDAYDQGRAALTQDKLDEAERLGAQAVEALPGEPHFHTLLGDVDAERDRYTQAIAHYDAAIARDDGFFYPYLRRGLMQQQAGQAAAAEESLRASIDRLPTADAYHALGVLAERRGDRSNALSYYEQAAGANTETGRAAQDAAARLDLPANPSKYLALRSGLDSNQSLVLELSNPTRLTITDIALVIRYVDAGGAIREITRQWPQRIEPNTAQRLGTGIGPLPSDGYQVELRSARIVQ
jgi:predicted Zn-dependent protease